MGKTRALTKDQLRKIKRSLLQRRTQLSDNLKSGLEEIESHEGHHLADLEDIDDVQDNDAVFEVVNVSSSTLEQIDRALEKIEKGSYGICEDCNSAIAAERLRALPFATQCIECKRKAEIEEVNGA